VHLACVLMDAREEKLFQPVCSTVSHWGHQVTDSKHVAALAVVQGNGVVGRGAHMNTMIVLEAAELQQS